MREIRTKLKMDGPEFAWVLGYRGQNESLETHIRRFELGGRKIPPWIERLVLMYDAYGVPKEWRK